MMSLTMTGRIRRTLLASAIVGSVTAVGIARPSHSVAATPTPPRHDRHAVLHPAVGTDLYHRDTATAQYIQGENDHVHLHLYNGPEGIPTTGGWQARDRHLQRLNGTGLIAPAHEPFDLRLALTSGGPTLASLTNEDRVTLGVGLGSLNSASLPAVVGQIGTDAVTYTAPAASTPSDVSLRSTESGLDVRVVLHNANEGGPIVLTLAPDRQAQLSQEASGAIEVTRPITRYGDNGQPLVTIQPEYIIAAPVVRDSGPDAGVRGLITPVTTVLAPAVSNGQDLTLTIDPAWMRDAHRTFPVRVDVPIATAYSAVNSGTFGTVTSCAPAAPAPQTDVAVGIVGGCAYHGELYFNTSPLRYDTAIVSATLHLYTPGQAGTTGVQLYADTPPSSTPYQPLSWEPPNWNSAPAVAPGAAGIVQSGSDGHEQSWDVTNLVRHWVSNERTNAGLTLVGNGTPVVFASPLGAGTATPAKAPSLDITYAPYASQATTTAASAPQVTTAASSAPIDNASYYTGVAGTFGDFSCSSSGLCTQKFSNGLTYAALSVDKVPETTSSANATSYTGQLAGSYVRLGATLSCTSTTPGYGWWTSFGVPTSAAPYDLDTVYSLMEQAYIDGLIPIVTLRQDDNCSAFLTPSAWASEAKDFINGFYVEAEEMPKPLPMTYFEIGNEVNDDGAYGSGGGAYGGQSGTYATLYATTAVALSSALNSYNGNGTSPYRILTSGMLSPTAAAPPACPDKGGDGKATGYYNIDEANNALNQAENYPYSVLASRLGVAIHPYDYDTNDTQTYWQNYYTEYSYTQMTPNGPVTLSNGYAGVCGDLGNMLNQWTNSYFPGVPVIATEDNWSTDPQNHIPSCNNANCRISCSNAAGCSGTYLVDLLTWLSDNNYDCMTVDPSIGCSSASTFRLSWFRGLDVATPTFSSNPIDPLGIYGQTGPPATLVEKNFTTNFCPYDNNVQGTHSIANAYWELGSCY